MSDGPTTRDERAIHNAEDDGAAVLAVSEILRSQIAHLAKATTEPTREQTVTDAMVEDAIEAYNDCASYNTQAVNMRAALEAALFRAEAKPDALGRYHRIGPDGFCEDCG